MINDQSIWIFKKRKNYLFWSIEIFSPWLISVNAKYQNIKIIKIKIN
jgi:hypothetical protein